MKRLISSCAVGALLVVGCGGSDPGEVTETPTDVTAPPAATTGQEGITQSPAVATPTPDGIVIVPSTPVLEGSSGNPETTPPALVIPEFEDTELEELDDLLEDLDELLADLDAGWTTTEGDVNP